MGRVPADTAPAVVLAAALSAWGAADDAAVVRRGRDSSWVGAAS
jgi:type II secretory pathway component PulK